MRLIFLIIFVTNYTSGNAQLYFQRVFSHTGNHGWLTDVRATSDGGYIMSGSIKKYNTDYDGLLIKLNSTGDTIWTKIFALAGADEVIRTIQTSDGGYLACLHNSSGTLGGNIALLKLNSSGDTTFCKLLGPYNVSVWSLMETSDNGFIIAVRGDVNDFEPFIIKTDQDCDTQWTRHMWIPSYTTEALSIRQTSDGGYVFCGFGAGPATGTYDGYIVKTDANGDTLWTKGYGDSGSQYFECIRQTSDGGYIVSGRTSGPAGGTFDDVLLVKTDAIGNIIWSNTYGDSLLDEDGSSIEITSDGGYFIAGTSRTTTDFNALGLKTDGSGALQWVKEYGTSSAEDKGVNGIQCVDGGYLIAGSTMSFTSGFMSGYLIKTESNGNSGCNQHVPPMIQSPVNLPVAPWVGLDQLNGSYDTIAIPILGGVVVTQPCFGVGTEESDFAKLVNFYPNPFNEHLTLDFSDQAGSFTIYDIAGNVVKESTISYYQMTINTINMPSGFYLLNLQAGDNNLTYKLVKN
jgi:hypothetical protein